jgi:NADH-quinone oxidoreductase subunit A
LAEFFPIGILLAIAFVVCATIFLLSKLLSFKSVNPNPAKYTTYESGMKPEGGAHQPFRTSFYMVAVLFLLFDVEAAFFFPWALVYRESRSEGGALFLGIIVYLALMVLGLLYIFRKDGLRLNAGAR